MIAQNKQGNKQMQKRIRFFLGIVITFLLAGSVFSATPPNKILIINADIFDGKNQQLKNGMSLLVEGNKIKKIAKSIPVPSNATVIDAKGKVLMPGLTDAHWHSMFNFWPISKVMNEDIGYLSIAAAKEAKKTLLRGFTTVRDVGGNAFAVYKATNEGVIDGPRIYPSGPYLSQTAGHGDFRGPLAVPSNIAEPLDYFQRVGHTIIADGVPEVIKRSREILRMGSTQIKVMAGGGVSSLYDPLDVTQYTIDEMKAVVEVAKNWNTYVVIHANTDDAIKKWVKAGAMSVEHGFFIQDDTAKLMKEKGAWWSMQPLGNDEDALQFENPISTAKYEEVVSGLDKAVALTKKYKVNTAFGTDTLFDSEAGKKQGKLLAKLQKWYTPYEALKMATHDNVQLFKLSGPRDPYPGKLGVIEEGAYADMILVNGNPLKDLNLVADPDKNFALIMKDGKIYKNTIN